MKLLAVATILTAASAAVAQDTARTPITNLPGYEEPARPWPNLVESKRARNCRDRIEWVREEMGQPKFEREPASPDKPLMMYAVDHRVDGCGVLVPVANPADIRQAPEPGRPEVIPAR